jgi:hypothetical protein
MTAGDDGENSEKGDTGEIGEYSAEKYSRAMCSGSSEGGGR